MTDRIRTIDLSEFIANQNSNKTNYNDNTIYRQKSNDQLLSPKSSNSKQNLQSMRASQDLPQ
jgi:hypothetical protein